MNENNKFTMQDIKNKIVKLKQSVAEAVSKLLNEKELHEFKIECPLGFEFSVIKNNAYILHWDFKIEVNEVCDIGLKAVESRLFKHIGEDTLQEVQSYCENVIINRWLKS